MINNKYNSNTTFNDAVNALNSAKNILFSSQISNEEAYLLQTLKEKRDINLFNFDAYAFSNFLSAFSQGSGQSLYNGTLKDIKQSDQIIILGSRICTDETEVYHAIKAANQHNKAYTTYMHPIEEILLKDETQFIKYEVGSEEGVMALLLQALTMHCNINKEIKTFLSNLDDGYLFAQTNIGQEEIEEIIKIKSKAKKTTLILGQDLYTHDKACNIAKMAGLIERYSNIRVLIIQAESNTLGISLICNLTKPKDDNFTFDITTLNGEKGTVVNIDKKVVINLNNTLLDHEYTFLELCKAINLTNEPTLSNYTKYLPTSKGFKLLDMINGDHKEYTLTPFSVNIDETLSNIDTLPEFNGTIIYDINLLPQINNELKKPSKENILRGSSQFAIACEISNNNTIMVEFNGKKDQYKFKLDKNLKGMVALHFTSKKVKGTYRFTKVNIFKGRVNE